MYVRGEPPGTHKGRKYYREIQEASIYFVNDFNGRWQLQHLPYGDAVGIDNHPAVLMDRLFLIQSYVNQQIKKKQDRKKRK
ncbi:hypothetical protein [Fuchsiella alkaliacetigena]|uniref:hypothetical protein n=1 Tax=Fuchsiella alkaliacetigena TaxID=957042 RepID=UPI00200A47D4|nr:hypothetical protein [Fuchsiella alkaliacetigena]MCK8824735.1 hypothetical protein [Fuchsiella alkaliacetigena]